MELGVLGPLQVRQYGLPVAVPGAKPRAVLTVLGLHDGSVVPAETLVELLWGSDPPRTAVKALQTHISALRRALGDGFVLTEGAGWRLNTAEVDAIRYKSAAKLGRDAIATGDAGLAVARFDEALRLWRGAPELPDSPRGLSERTRWIEGHAALVEDRADALLATGRAAEIIGELEAAIADAPLRERRWGHLMLALYRAGRQGEALGAYQRVRSLLADELGVDPGPDLRRLEASIVAQDVSLELPVTHQYSAVTRAVTFLLTDIEGSTAAWENDADAMAGALARHDEIVEQVVTSRGGRLVKTRGEGDATFSVFDRPSAAAAAAVELQEAVRLERWAPAEPVRIRVALHTGEVEFRDGDYFGRAVNRAARLRSLAAGGQILCSGATAELVIDSLSDDVLLADLGMRHLKNLPRPEHVFELRLETADDSRPVTADTPMQRPALPSVLAGQGPFVGRVDELGRLLSAWELTLNSGTGAVLIAGEPGVGKTRLAGEWSRQAYDHGAVVLYGRCDEDLGAPYQPFAEALRTLVPSLGADRLRGLRGVEALLPLVPGLTDALPDLSAPTRADPDTERYALFDAVVALLDVVATGAPVVMILDDLHWATKPTLLLLRHLLRFGEHARVQIIGTYRSTDLDRAHPLAAMLADLHRDGAVTRLQLDGLDEDDVTTYVAEAGYDDEDLARALSSVTGGNPFFLIEALRHVDESGGRWDPTTLPQGIREAVSRRLSRLPVETNNALATAAVVGSRFAVELVEKVVEEDLVDAFDEACKAGIIIEEPGGRYRFNHALVRQSLLAELASMRRMRLHQRIAATLETHADSDDELLAELAYHYFECAWAGNAAKAMEYCTRAADQAMTRLAYEGAAELYDKALHALEELDDALPDRDERKAELLVARCEALLAAGDVVSATGAVTQLRRAAGDSGRLAAWGTCFDGQLAILTAPERLDEVESAVTAAAEKLAELDDAAGEAMAHTVRAGCLGRLGRIADCEAALDQALTAARRAHEHRRVNAVLATAPLAALWGPNPVPRAGGRCLDVVRLLRITTGSPVVEATSTRCQGVLDAFRGRAAAGRQLIDSARRSLTEVGMRHALLEVDQFAGIVELVAGDPAAAEPHLRRAYNGFRRMGLEADTAETAALLARTCLALGQDGEADQLCTESERLAGHALKASIAWRTVRAQLLSRHGDHDEARRIAEEAVAIAERTDALVDHGDACLTLAMVLGAAGDRAGARAAAERAVGLYDLKGAAALAEMTQRVLGMANTPAAPSKPVLPIVELENACARAADRLFAAVEREAWDDVEQLVARLLAVESRRKIVGYPYVVLSPEGWVREAQRGQQSGLVHHRHAVLEVRGERLALSRLEISSADTQPGGPRDEFLCLLGLDDDGQVALLLFFDVEDIDAAIAELNAIDARFEEQSPRAPLENAASRAEHHLNALFASRSWDEIAACLVDDVHVEERRRGFRRESDDRADLMAEIRVVADLGVKNITSDPVAIRGERLVLSRARFSGRAPRPDAYQTEVLRLAQIDTDGRVTAFMTFDTDDIEAAITELDARYAAGEAAPHARTWSVIAAPFAGLKRGELPATTVDWVNIDHRRGRAFAPGQMFDFVRAGKHFTQDLWPYIDSVHRLSDRGAVVTYTATATSSEGFQAEWREVSLSMAEGDLISRCEIFDLADLDAALSRFDELSRPVRRLENAASRAYDRLNAYLAARDWDALAEMVADDICNDDRRRIVSSGIQRGRDAQMANLQAAAALGVTDTASAVIATRGERLVLARYQYAGSDGRPQSFNLEILSIVEINTDNQIAAIVLFDLDDIESAFAELDARYATGEAAPHAHAWSLLTANAEAFNRHEFPAWTADVANVDHRRVTAFAPGDQAEYVRATWEQSPDLKIYIEAVHRLGDLGAVITYIANGTSHQDFDAEWRGIALGIIERDRFDRTERFDEADLDAALRRFDELARPATHLANVATRVSDRFVAAFGDRRWDDIGALLNSDFQKNDHRKGFRQEGSDGVTFVDELRAVADLGAQNLKMLDVIAVRGERLALSRSRVSGRDTRPEAFHTELLGLIEIDDDEQISAFVLFDIDDFDSAIEELDARYLAGEATPYAHAWKVVAGVNTALNRRELPATTRNCVNIDHRQVAAIASNEMSAFVHASWQDYSNFKTHIEVVHRISEAGVVVTWAGQAVSHDGFEAEWRVVNILMIDGDRMSRSEIFDEADLETAVARFDELSCPAMHLQNAASQAHERLLKYYNVADWDSVASLFTEDISNDDRRRTVNAGMEHGRDIQMSNLRRLADIGARVSTSVLATRGQRLVLNIFRTSNSDLRYGEFDSEMLNIIETNSDGRITAGVLFDLDDIDAAFAELDARYLAGEAAPHAHAWSVVKESHSAFNRRELPVTTPDWVSVDHRRAIPIPSGDLLVYIEATWEQLPDVKEYVETVHRLTDVGAVVTQVVRGTSGEGFPADWRLLVMSTVDGDLINRIEIFDETDLDAALARFDELSSPASQLKNAASQVGGRFLAHVAAGDWDGMAQILDSGFPVMIGAAWWAQGSDMGATPRSRMFEQSPNCGAQT
ncbi:hypothetical protein DVS77_02520 [Mycolicibacterium moriokaense]|nr:hypothetical protein DVS77_02520 [Mycolicibacterium moriokaense]